MSAEAAADVGGAAAHEHRRVYAAGDGQVGPLAHQGSVEGKETSPLYAEGVPHRCGPAIEPGGEVCAGQGHGCVFQKFELWADEGHLKGGAILVVPQKDVCET